MGNLTDVTAPSGRKTHYEYDDNGRLTKTTRPDGSSESYEYDLAGRVTRAEDKNGGATIHCYQYTYDLQGNIIKITESGNTGEIGTLTSASMTYTKDNRLDTYNGQKVTYDEDGNMTYGPLNGVMASFTYDCRNRLIKAGDTTYEYDAENTRIAVQTKDRREEYTVDKEAAYSQVLSITTYEKNLLGQYRKETGYTIYTYGNGLISQEDIQKTDTGSGTPGKSYYLYHYNQVGSTTQITDEKGNIIYRYAYSPYGERMGTYDGNGNRISDDTPIRFLYNGRFGVETDQSGLYYMRARYYNTDIKRFINRDILTGSIENSQSLNQYSYVQGNPVILADPFGLCPEGGGTENIRNLLGHTVLDILGFVPVIGFAFDIANGIWYAKEKQGLMAAACFIAAIPGAGDLLGTGIKWLAKGEKAIKTAQAVSTTFRMVGAIGQTGLAAINLGIAINAVVEEYQSSYNGRVSTLSLVNLGASVLGVVIGIHSARKSIQNFKSMWNGMRSKSISFTEYDSIYQSSIHNAGKDKVMLGKYDGGGPTSYITKAGDDYTYFSLGNEWETIKAKYGYTDADMFKLFNEAFLDDGINAGKAFQFSHNPINDTGALGQEYLYLLKNNYKWDAGTMTMKSKY